MASTWDEAVGSDFWTSCQADRVRDAIQKIRGSVSAMNVMTRSTRSVPPGVRR